MRPMSIPRRHVVAATGALAAVVPFAAPAVAQTIAPAGQATAASAAPAKAPSALRVTHRRTNVTLGRRIVVSGRLLPGAAGRTVTLEARGARGWKTVAKDRTSARGAYRLSYKPRRPSSVATRVRFAGDPQTRSSTRGAGRANAFRRAFVSWYGPGLYGGHLACGG